MISQGRTYIFEDLKVPGNGCVGLSDKPRRGRRAPRDVGGNSTGKCPEPRLRALSKHIHIIGLRGRSVVGKVGGRVWPLCHKNSVRNPQLCTPSPPLSLSLPLPLSLRPLQLLRLFESSFLHLAAKTVNSIKLLPQITPYADLPSLLPTTHTHTHKHA